MNWAISLIINESETIEQRLEKIISYVIERDKIDEFILYNIDATGQFGNHLTKKMNDQKGQLIISEKEVLSLVSEDGQVFELDLFLKNSREIRFFVRDGTYIDIVGNGEKISTDEIGGYNELDINLFHP